MLVWNSPRVGRRLQPRFEVCDRVGHGSILFQGPGLIIVTPPWYMKCFGGLGLAVLVERILSEPTTRSNYFLDTAKALLFTPADPPVLSV